jgi:hypothetical protein
LGKLRPDLLEPQAAKERSMARHLNEWQMSLEVEELEVFLEPLPHLAHLKVRTWGDSMILYSGDKRDRQNHARLTYLDRDVWGLSFPKHAGGWERIPMAGTIQEMMDTLEGCFGAYLEPF